MWILTSSGPALNNQRKWLKPGSSYTISRKADVNDTRHVFSVLPKWVSREHLEIKVHPVMRNSLEHTSFRSEVELIDKGTRLGTLVGDSTKIADGKSVKVASLAESGPITIRLGSRNVQDTTFTLTWSPMVITVSSNEMEKDLQQMRSKLEDMDIKVLTFFHSLTSCYVKSPNKESSKLLYALIRDIPIVSPEYLQALVDSESAMELNFDEKPDTSKFLPDAELAPNSKRQECLKGLTFFFTDFEQFYALNGIVINAGGEAVLLEKSGYTTVKEIIDFITRKTEQSSPVILKEPRNQSKNGKSKLLESAVAELGLRLVENREFLNTIVRADPHELHAKSLKRTVERIDSAEKIAVKKPHRMIKRREPRIINFLDMVKQESSQTAAEEKIKESDADIDEDAVESAEVFSTQPPRVQIAETPAGQNRLDILSHTTPSAPQYDTAQTEQSTASVPEPSVIISERPVVSLTTAPELVPDLDDEPFENIPENDGQPEEMMLSVNDLTIDRIRRLTLVENCIQVQEQNVTVNRSMVGNEEWQGRPNFKRFIRRGQTPHVIASPVIQEAVRIHTGAFQKRDRETMEMLQNTSITPDPADNLAKRPRMRTSGVDDIARNSRLNIAGDDENSLIFAESVTPSLSESTTPSLPKTQQRKSLFISDDDDDDDDDYTFKFRFS